MRKEVAIEHTLASDVAAGATFDVDYPSGYSQSDFTGDDASTSVMGADHDDLPVSLGASAATITWPAGKSTTLPAGTQLTIGLKLVQNDNLPERLEDLMQNVAELTDNSGGTAGAAVAAVSGSGADADINNNFASIVAKQTAILDALKNAGLMVAD